MIKHMNKMLIILLFGTGYLFSQVLVVTANVDFDHLPEETHDELAELGTKIEDYLNNYAWTDDEFEYDVNTTAQIIIETVQDKTHEKLYRAQFLISSESGESFYDKLWEFPYTKNYTLNHGAGQFDPVSRFLDYYAMVILAGEMDTNGLLLGSTGYEQAMDIVNQAILSQYARGWNQRKEDLLKITDIRTRPLREVKPDFFEALYLYEEGDHKKAYKYALKVLDGIKKVMEVQPNNWYLQMFFRSHYRNLAMLFENQNNELDLLTKFDSKHREAYRAKMK